MNTVHGSVTRIYVIIACTIVVHTLAPLSSAIADASASCSFAVADPAPGRPAPRLTVNGEPVLPRGMQPRKERHEWLVPAKPVADALGGAIEFSPVTRSVTITDPLDGAAITYDGGTGDVRQGATSILVLSPGLVRGAVVSDLLLPLSLVAALFRAEVHVAPDESEIAIVTAATAGAPAVTGLSPIGLREIRYQGYVGAERDRYQGGLSLDSDARVGKGRFRSHAYGQLEEDGRSRITSAAASFDDGAGNVLHGGQVRSGAPVRWLGSFGTGFRWDGEREGGRQRLTLGYLQFETAEGTRHVRHVLSGGGSWGARAGAPVGQSYGVGGAFIGGERAAAFVAAQRERARPGLRLTNRVGMSLVDGGGIDGLGTEADVDWLPLSHVRAALRLGAFGPGFRTPGLGHTPDASRLVSATADYTPRSWLSLTASSWIQTYHTAAAPTPDATPVPDDGMSTRDGGVAGSRERQTTLSAAAMPRRGPLASMRLGVVETAVRGQDGRYELTMESTGRIPRGDWFLSGRMLLEGELPAFLVGGVSTTFGFGTVQLAGSGRENLDAISVHWSHGLLGGRRMRVAAGGRWLREPMATGDSFLGDVRISYDLVGGHRVDLSVDERPGSTLTRVGMRGQLVFDEGRVVPVPGRTDVAGPHLGRVRGRVYLDANANGVFDGSDRPLGGVGVRLDGGRMDARTSSDGTYEFPSVRAGSHRVEIALTSVRADLSILGPATHDVVVPAFRAVDVAFRTGINRAIRGVVFLDEDRDGVQGEGEEGLPEARVLLAGGRDTFTGADGSFRLSDVPPGVYVVMVDLGSVIGTGEIGAADGAGGTAATSRPATPSGSAVAVPVEVVVSSSGDPAPVALAVTPAEREVQRVVFRAE